ncbi:MAG: hypothetical protein DCC75_07380 [Proteobacteria bacterium]|nr:MAG: hypothetical protein DCC75_07380 [Pseudomonadota bacterium]
MNQGSRKKNPHTGAAHYLVLPLLAIVGLYFLFFIVFGYTIAPGTIGVRQIKFGPGQGFTAEGLEPGAHWGLPGYTVVDQEVGDLPTLEIQTADRATVDVDITVLTRFYSGPGEDIFEEGGEKVSIKHGGPAELVKKIGVYPERWQNHIRKITEDELKRTLGKISTGQFYDPHKREEQLIEARKKIIRSLAPDGIRLEAVLLRRYTYREDRIDQAIFQKNLQDQEERLNVTASKLAEAQAALEQVAAEWDAKIETLRVQGENKARVIRSEGDLYESEKKAEGDLEVAKARAEVDKMRAEVLTHTAGSDIFVARELAGVVGSLRGGLVSDLDPYDFEGWMQRLGVGKGQ